MSEKIKIYGVVGPTASGKTALAIELAKRIDGEIICCDSMQIYKDMDIGTAKPTTEERAAVPHHMTDFLPPEVAYSCADYVKDAEAVVLDIVSRGKKPIFCGGTGLYLDRFLRGGNSDDASCDPEYRKELTALSLTEGGVDKLHNMLSELDPESAEAIHKNNVKRVIRALEIIKATGRKKSDVDKDNSEFSDKYEASIIYTFYQNRAILNERIERRVDMMVDMGLVEETKRLYDAGVFAVSSTAAQAIGYKELIPYIESVDNLENCIEKLKTATRKYAKRQNTWFSQKPYCQKILMDDEFGAKTFENIVNISQTYFIN